MSTYIDGFVLSVRREKLDAYTAIATRAGQIWREHGALEYREYVGDDMDVKDMVSFPELAKAASDEVVIFAWAVFKSREHRDEANKKIMADTRLAELCPDPQSIFDCKRMAYGGFRSLVSC